MTTTRIRPIALALTVAALAVAGCGDDDDDAAEAAVTTAEAAPTPPPATEPAPTTVEVTVPPTTEPAPEPTTAATEAPAPTDPPDELDAVELMTSLGIVGTDYSPDHTILNDVTDVNESATAIAGRDAVAATEECAPPTVETFPYSSMSSAARIDFIDAIGASASAELIVMKNENAAAAYLNALRGDEMYPTCVGRSVEKVLQIPEGIDMALENFRFGESITGYGDDQVSAFVDLVFSQGGTVLVSAAGGTRHSRIDDVILVVGGVSPTADEFAARYYEMVVEALG